MSRRQLKCFFSRRKTRQHISVLFIVNTVWCGCLFCFPIHSYVREINFVGIEEEFFCPFSLLWRLFPLPLLSQRLEMIGSLFSLPRVEMGSSSLSVTPRNKMGLLLGVEKNSYQFSVYPHVMLACAE